MAQFNNTTKKDIKDLNPKQTVIIEVVTKDSKKAVNVYLGNWKRRQDAFYLGMVANEMKEVRKGEETKHYRLLKLSKLLAEVGVPGYNTKTNYLIIEGYDNDAVVARPKEETAPAEAPEEVKEETPTEEAPAEEEKKEEKWLDAVVTEDVE